MSEAKSNLSHIAAAVTLARHIAKREIKREGRKQGIRLQQFDAHDIAKAAKAYLNEHRAELIEQARAHLSTFAQKPRR